MKLVRTVKPMVSDLDTYLNKAIPDTKHTIRKYADVKFEYLSFCLKVSHNFIMMIIIIIIIILIQQKE